MVYITAVENSPDPQPFELVPCIIFKFSDDATIIQCYQLNGSVIPTRDTGGSKIDTQYLSAGSLLVTSAVTKLLLWYILLQLKIHQILNLLSLFHASFLNSQMMPQLYSDAN